MAARVLVDASEVGSTNPGAADGRASECYKTTQIKVDQTKNKNTDFYVENPNGKKPRNARRRITIIGGVLQYTRGQTLYVLSI
jgi:hypothetical protein